MLQLRIATSPEWTRTVLGDLDAFLLDHAACERKASATAMSLVAHYPDRPELIEAMVELAREELLHFQQVFAVIRQRGLHLGGDAKDPYLRGLMPFIRHGRETYFMDRLLLGGVVEARGCERFGLLAAALPDPALRDLYAELTRSEARHRVLFVRLAQRYFDGEQVAQRLSAWLDHEAQVVAALPLRAALH